jgi:hypothetical protein
MTQYETSKFWQTEITPNPHRKCSGTHCRGFKFLKNMLNRPPKTKKTKIYIHRK